MIRSNRLKIFETALLIALAISGALAIQAWAVKPFKIPSGSMEPTLDIGQRVLVDRLSGNLGSDPEPGDVVVFHPPLSAVPEEQETGEPVPRCGVSNRPGLDRVCPKPFGEAAEKYFIKRVVAGPGDRLKIRDGIPIVNGEPFQGDWETLPCGPTGCDYPEPITVPDDHYFLLGDNRPGSDDSRFWGPVPREWIIGKAFASYWPLREIGGL